jgi:hypothetical protein
LPWTSFLFFTKALSVFLSVSVLFGSSFLVERELGKEGKKKKQQRTWRRKKRWEKTSI